MRAHLAPAALLLLSIQAACPGPWVRPAPTPPPVPPRGDEERVEVAPVLPPAPEPARWVLVRAGARLHRLAHSGEAPRHPAPARPADPGRAMVFRRIADHGAWLEVESLPALAAGHCHAPDPRLSGLALRLFVHRSDLLAVLRTPVTQHYPDGTRLGLAPGVALSAPLDFEAPAGESIRHVEVDGLSLNVEAPDAATGIDYAPAPLGAQPPPDGQTLALPPGTTLRYGLGARVVVQTPRTARVLGTASSQHRIRVASACIDLVALLGAGDRPRPPPAEASEPPPSEGARTGPGLRPGTVLTWPGGHVAGRTTALARFDRVVEERPARVCLARDLPLFAGGRAGDDDPEPLVVCAPRSALVPAGR